MARFWPRRFVDDERSNIGNVLLKMGALTEAELETAVSRQDGTKRLGEILIERGVIDQEALDLALALQKDLRNGKAVDAMLRIVEDRTERQHAQMTALVASMAQVLPIVVASLVGCGYVVFDRDMSVVSAVEGPLAPDSDPGRMDRVEDLVDRWQPGATDSVRERILDYFRACLDGEGAEMILALNGRMVRVSWIPLTESSGAASGGVLVAQDPGPLVHRLRETG